MTVIQWSASAVWNGNLPNGSGEITTTSGTLTNTPYSFKTRFEQSSGVSPEELIAAAYAACYSMAFAQTLSEKGFRPRSIETHARCLVEPQAGGLKITKMQLETQGQVAGIDTAQFQQIAHEAEAAYPISGTMKGNMQIELKAILTA